MSKRRSIKPKKDVSVIGMIVGLGMVFIGITKAIPDTGEFGVVWTFVAAGITLANAVDIFSKNGVTSFLIDVEEDDSNNEKEEEIDEKLIKIKALKDEEIISAEEYEAKKKEILSNK